MTKNSFKDILSVTFNEWEKIIDFYPLTSATYDYSELRQFIIIVMERGLIFYLPKNGGYSRSPFFSKKDSINRYVISSTLLQCSYHEEENIYITQVCVYDNYGSQNIFYVSAKFLSILSQRIIELEEVIGGESINR